MEKRSLKEQIEEKFPHNYDIIDLEARNAFKCKEVTAVVLKCACGCNHCKIRNALINNNLTEKEYPHCNAIETWDHAIRCLKVRQKQREFIIQLTKQLTKKDNGKIEVKDIFDALEDIVAFFNGEEEEDNKEEFETSQRCIGMKSMFRGYAVRDWKQANFHCTKCTELNKVIMRNAVLFYYEC